MKVNGKTTFNVNVENTNVLENGFFWDNVNVTTLLQFETQVSVGVRTERGDSHRRCTEIEETGVCRPQNLSEASDHQTALYVSTNVWRSRGQTSH